MKNRAGVYCLVSVAAYQVLPSLSISEAKVSLRRRSFAPSPSSPSPKSAIVPGSGTHSVLTCISSISELVNAPAQGHTSWKVYLIISDSGFGLISAQQWSVLRFDPGSEQCHIFKYHFEAE